MNQPRTPTRIERLAPGITELAASIGQEVYYYGGNYFLMPCHRSLWYTRTMGRLTEERAEIARIALAEMVERVKPAQSKPMPKRIGELAKSLTRACWIPNHFTVVTTTALDRGALDRFMGKWSVKLTMGNGPDVEVRDHEGTREEAINAAVALALAALDEGDVTGGES